MDPSAESPESVLLQLQLRVARRADEIAREMRLEGSLNLHCWLVAETELIARVLRDARGSQESGMEPAAGD